MYCDPCRAERLGTARFCVICGTALHARPKAEIESDLSKVRWLLSELTSWDQMSIAPKARQYVVDRYRARERILVSALTEAPGAPPPAVERQPEAAPPQPE